MKDTASVIYWNNISEEEATEILQELINKGLITHHDTREYEDSYGSPVWYIP